MCILQNDKPMLGFGAMRLPVVKDASKRIDWIKADKLVTRAMELGVNYFDTAYGYHNKESEVFLGEILSKFGRQDYFLTTKLPLWKVHSIEDAKRIFFAQLEKLKTDYIDLYLLHNWEGEARYQSMIDYQVIAFLDDLKRQGVIKHLGFSYHDVPEVLEKRLDLYNWDAVQLQVNYVDWFLQGAQKSHDLLVKRGIPIIAMEPLRGGRLSQLSLPEQDIFQKGGCEMSPAAFALNWVKEKTKCKVILSGMTTVAQLEENVTVFSEKKPLSRSEKEIAKDILDLFMKSKQILCTSCEYCCPCSVGINIPKYIDLFNRDIQGIGLASFGFEYQKLALDSANVNRCISCRKCENKCPQKINIVDVLEKVKSRYSEYITFK